ncbi:MAG TPA: DUF3048 domain-containing protein [Pseudonocardiaceae bacterium]|nr:DUF3048 domain-containing protein [Pseudonocardiaceae bacterium]
MGRSTALAAVLLAAMAIAGCTTSNGSPGDNGTTDTSSASTGTLSGPVIAVKIDNVADARPSTGVGSAQVVYVEPVEGGLTRIVAVFTAPYPSVIGPVRSARLTDLDLLGQYGKPVFAFSGSVPELIPLLHQTAIIDASQASVAKAYVRQNTHAAPHNLYLRPSQLPTGSPPSQAPLEFGAAPAGGTQTTSQKIGYSAASFSFAWSTSDSRWLITMDGKPYQTTDGGQVGAATVVLQKVATHPEPWKEDSTGSITPVAQTVGTGSATVLRDGQSFAATWSRSAVDAPTHFTVTSSGADLPLANGPVWIFLVPAS